MHFYTIDGVPQHTQPTKAGAKNATRPTDIRDARKLGLLASVTTIMDCTLANAGLAYYKQSNLLAAAYACQPGMGETLEEWSRHIATKADEGRETAADTGTAVHNAIERALTQPDYAPPPEIASMVEQAVSFVRMLGIDQLETERCIVNHAHHYAGTVDISGYIANPDGQIDLAPTCPLILDFKTKRTKQGIKIDVPETYPWQLAAYHVSKFGPQQRDLHPLALAGNVFISTTEPGRMEAVWYDREDLEHAWECYRACNRLFQLRNKLNYR